MCGMLDYEVKTWEMSWVDFKTSVDPAILQSVCGGIPNSYIEFCDLYDENRARRELVDVSVDEAKTVESESESEDIDNVVPGVVVVSETSDPDDGYDSV
jgi:hypothetical protein